MLLNPRDITAPKDGYKVPAGEAYSIQWELGSHHDDKVTIKLFAGIGKDQTNFNELKTIGKGIDNSKGSYSWTPNTADDTSLTYMLTITSDSDDSVYQLSDNFQIITEPDDVSATTTEGTQTSQTSSQTSVTTVVTTASTTSSMQGISSASGDSTITSSPTTTSLSGGSSATSSSSSPSSTSAVGRNVADIFAMILGLALVMYAQ
ncbi:hypothetical protein PFICI_08573 [Pestalotiopsis fici W106-1]|uniref:Yeast cell wall synthesis Kre9/Knh1-like N-terminal domain-containing protein n=1 Tax=Pestalotiopsis fici (strain W106-1 / CGMCC3.15140) TaxID=1229662 RepID=W3WY19_PESFW|nr:uncharacterized protein PFICI_08573 [Pestalotiopsis fici W106-1]ETS78720.1 hypothetical protein PFICI_08573 [Pestalotiopsis fici W106-1]